MIQNRKVPLTFSIIPSDGEMGEAKILSAGASKLSAFHASWAIQHIYSYSSETERCGQTSGREKTFKP